MITKLTNLVSQTPYKIILKDNFIFNGIFLEHESGYNGWRYIDYVKFFILDNKKYKKMIFNWDEILVEKLSIIPIEYKKENYWPLYYYYTKNNLDIPKKFYNIK